ncbi:hypothetical protein MTES_3572 [Microbacterium testaceum StLB037]|uniref:Uncharacterized protein n=1 Tax=Microbacterium testaceum (strain StLB037) TaxID=979556 RepID=E8NG65_MICTS|nr:hypothetical protein MTES_3572 [Microbacterium testaceum StLB037]
MYEIGVNGDEDLNRARLSFFLLSLSDFARERVCGTGTGRRPDGIPLEQDPRWEEGDSRSN